MNSLPDDLQQKLNYLTSYIDELNSWHENPPEGCCSRALQRILERMVQLIVECAADAGDLWLQMKGYETGESVRGVFERLRESGLINDEEIERFAEYVSLRNRIVHDYERVTMEQLQGVVPQLLADCHHLCRKLIEG